MSTIDWVIIVGMFIWGLHATNKVIDTKVGQLERRIKELEEGQHQQFDSYISLLGRVSDHERGSALDVHRNEGP